MIVDLGHSAKRTDFVFFTMPSPRTAADLAVTTPATRSAIAFGGQTPKRVRVRWYFCPPDAKPIPGGSIWASTDWSNIYELADTTIGEVPRTGTSKGNRLGLAPIGVTGQRVCGRPIDFLEAKVWNPDAPVVRRGPTGVPICCNPALSAPIVFCGSRASYGPLGLGGSGTIEPPEALLGFGEPFMADGDLALSDVGESNALGMGGEPWMGNEGLGLGGEPDVPEEQLGLGGEPDVPEEQLGLGGEPDVPDERLGLIDLPFPADLGLGSDTPIGDNDLGLGGEPFTPDEQLGLGGEPDVPEEQLGLGGEPFTGEEALGLHGNSPTPWPTDTSCSAAKATGALTPGVTYIITVPPSTTVWVLLPAQASYSVVSTSDDGTSPPSGTAWFEGTPATSCSTGSFRQANVTNSNFSFTTVTAGDDVFMVTSDFIVGSSYTWTFSFT